MLDWEITCNERRIPEQATANIKWKGENIKLRFTEKGLGEIRLLDRVREWWGRKRATAMCLGVYEGAGCACKVCANSERQMKSSVTGQMTVRVGATSMILTEPLAV